MEKFINQTMTDLKHSFSAHNISPLVMQPQFNSMV